MEVIFDVPEVMEAKIHKVNKVFFIADFSDSLYSHVLVFYENKNMDQDRYNQWSNNQHRISGMKTLGKFGKMPITVSVDCFDFPWTDETILVVSPTSTVVNWDIVKEKTEKYLSNYTTGEIDFEDNCSQSSLLYWMKNVLSSKNEINLGDLPIGDDGILKGRSNGKLVDLLNKREEFGEHVEVVFPEEVKGAEKSFLMGLLEDAYIEYGSKMEYKFKFRSLGDYDHTDDIKDAYQTHQSNLDEDKTIAVGHFPGYDMGNCQFSYDSGVRAYLKFNSFFKGKDPVHLIMPKKVSNFFVTGFLNELSKKQGFKHLMNRVSLSGDQESVKVFKRNFDRLVDNS